MRVGATVGSLYGARTAHALTDSASYAIADGALTITLSDGGTLGFEATPSS